MPLTRALQDALTAGNTAPPPPAATPRPQVGGVPLSPALQSAITGQGGAPAAPRVAAPAPAPAGLRPPAGDYYSEVGANPSAAITGGQAGPATAAAPANGLSPGWATFLQVLANAMKGMAAVKPGQGKLGAFAAGAGGALTSAESAQDRALKTKLLQSQEGRAERADTRAEHADTRAEQTHKLNVMKLKAEVARLMGGQLTPEQQLKIEQIAATLYRSGRAGAQLPATPDQIVRDAAAIRDSLMSRYRTQPATGGLTTAPGLTPTPQPPTRSQAMVAPRTPQAAAPPAQRQAAASAGPQYLPKHSLNDDPRRLPDGTATLDPHDTVIIVKNGEWTREGPAGGTEAYRNGRWLPIQPPTMMETLRRTLGSPFLVSSEPGTLWRASPVAPPPGDSMSTSAADIIASQQRPIPTIDFNRPYTDLYTDQARAWTTGQSDMNGRVGYVQDGRRFDIHGRDIGAIESAQRAVNAIAKARAAIAQGAPADKVKARLRAAGIQPPPGM
jgi:hypothetical protein